MDGRIIAQTILEQLGGNQFVVMTGAKQFLHGKAMLAFSLPRFSGVKVNRVRITLTSDDLYVVQFMKVGRTRCEVIKSVSGVYAEDLRGLFERTTGLATSLTRRFA